jgi:hypothetical protein
MTSVHRRTRRSASQASRPSGFRMVALLAAGITLGGAAYQSAFALGGSAAPQRLYHPPGGGGGLSGGEIAGIAGGGAGLGAAFWFLGTDRHKRCEEPKPDLPAGAEVESVDLVVESSTLEAGTGRCFHLLAKNKKDGKWYSVTHSPYTTFELVDPPHNPLVHSDTKKNVFMLPLTTAQSYNGQVVMVHATYAPPGAGKWEDEASVRLQVPGEEGLFRKGPVEIDDGDIGSSCCGS